MMRVIFFCAILALAVWAGVSMQASHGYVGINFAGWTVESPIWLALIALILVSIVIVSAFKLIHILMNLKAFFLRLRTERRLKKSKIKTTKGLLAFLEGDWHEAEHSLVAGAACIDLPFINYIFAAKAAGEQGHMEQANHYLKEAEKLTQEKDTVAYALQRARWLCQQNNWSEALTLLEPLVAEHGAHAELLNAAYKIYEQQKNWAKIIELMPGLIKTKVLTEAQALQVQKQAYGELILQAGERSLVEVKAVWKDMPKAVHTDSHLVCLYANTLLQHQLPDEAEQVLRQSIKRNWNEELIKLYGKVKSSYPQKQLAFAEHFLKEQPKSAVLLLTLGRLSLYHQLWGKAQRYLEASITLAPQAEAFSELGRLLMKLNKLEEAAEYFRRGLTMVTNQECLAEEPFMGLAFSATPGIMGISSTGTPSERILQD
jgi:HemY protein